MRLGNAMNKLSTVFALAGAMGCASLPLPPDQVEHLDASMRTARAIGIYRMSPDAENVGALGMAPAKEHLCLASDEAEVAEMMAAGGDKRGLLLLARAQSDIDLALELAREAELRRQARRAVAALRGMQVDDSSQPSDPKPPRGPWR
jgi:hypothetical protein